MRIGLASLKTAVSGSAPRLPQFLRTRAAKIVVGLFLVTLTGGFCSYFFLSSIFSPVQAKVSVSPKAAVAATPVPSMPNQQHPSAVAAPVAAQQNHSSPVTVSEHKAFTEKDPFKAEFLDRYKKAAPPKTSVALPAMAPDLARVLSATRGEGVATTLPTPPPTPAPKPQLKIHGVYSMAGQKVALTDKGELRIGAQVEGVKVTDITNDGISLDNGDRFTIGQKNAAK